jgi:hypothetical protein
MKIKRQIFQENFWNKSKKGKSLKKTDYGQYLLKLSKHGK